MIDFVKLNGVAIRTTGVYERTAAGENGVTLAEIELVVIVRGSMANRSLKQLLAKDPIRVDIPTKDDWISWDSTLQSANVASSGTGESAAHRYDLKLRETQESAIERASQPAAEVLFDLEYQVAALELDLPEFDEDLYLPHESPSISVATDSATWGAALKQMKDPQVRPAAPEAPLSPVELAAIESVLTNLRLDSVIDLLEAAGHMRRADVDRRFQQHVKARFVVEATPVVGEKVAKRAERDLLG